MICKNREPKGTAGEKSYWYKINNAIRVYRNQQNSIDIQLETGEYPAVLFSTRSDHLVQHHSSGMEPDYTGIKNAGLF
jgi:hypothetical protein